MPFCQNCGRPLNAGEICQCAAQQRGAAPQSTPYMNQLNQPYQYQPGQQQPQKKGVPTGCLIAAAIAIPSFLLVAAILAAILVPAMVGYTKKSKISAANTYARNVYRAASSVLVDLDAEDIDVGGAYIISNYGLEPKPAFDGGTYFDEMKAYMGDASTADLEYFAVVEDGYVVYVAVREIGNTYIGCYPDVSTTDGPVSITGEQYYEWDMARLEEDAQAEVRWYIESELDLDDAAYE